MATESLVAEEGIHAVSARMIARACGLRNNVSVQYHFGSMEELFSAVMQVRMSQLDVIRGDILQAKGWPRGRLERIAHAMELLCMPHLQLQSPSGHFPYASFLCEYLPRYHPGGPHWVMQPSEDDFSNRRAINARLREDIGATQPEIANRRIANAVLLFLNTLRGIYRYESSVESKDIIHDALIQATKSLC